MGVIDNDGQMRVALGVLSARAYGLIVRDADGTILGTVPACTTEP
jgi:hypothetical protein